MGISSHLESIPFLINKMNYEYVIEFWLNWLNDQITHCYQVNFLTAKKGSLRIFHGLNKRKRPLHSEVTSISYGWVVRSSKITLSTFLIRRVTFKVAFFDNFGAIYRKSI